MIITDFPQIDCPVNLGGILSFRFVPVEEVKNIQYNRYSFIYDDITLWTDWLKGYSTFEKKLVNSILTSSANGSFYKNELKGFFPGHSFFIEKLFAIMAQIGRRFVVEYTDYNGQRVLLGTKENGLQFSYEYTTQDAVKKLNGYSYRFYNDSETPRLTYYNVGAGGGGGGGS